VKGKAKRNKNLILLDLIPNKQDIFDRWGLENENKLLHMQSLKEDPISNNN